MAKTDHSSPVDEKILRAASNEFSRNGFYETVVKDIASRAGVGKGTVYRHFGNKKKLFGNLIENATDELIHDIEEIAQETDSLHRTIRGLLNVHFELFETRRHLVEIIVKEGVERAGDELKFVVNKWKSYRSRVADLFDEADRSDTDCRIKDSYRAAQLFLGQIWGHFKDRIIFDFESESDSYKREIFELFTGRKWDGE